MFLILGSPRSGTTLMRTTLNQHPDILVPDETDFIVPACMICDRVKDEAIGRAMVADLIIRSNRYAFSIGPYLTPKDIRALVNRASYSGMAIVEMLYDSIANTHGKALVGDKSPEDLFFLPVLLRGGLLERPIKVVHLVRDVRDVVLSLSKTPFRPPFLDTAFPFDWSRMNLALLRSMGDLPQRHLLVRFDDMVLDAEATFRSITAFLGVAFHSPMLSHEGRGSDKSGQVDHQNLDRPMLRERVGAWKREMNPDRSRAILDRARDALCQFGWVEPQAGSTLTVRAPEYLAANVDEHERVILRLQVLLDEQTAWARASAEEVSKRDGIIADLQTALREQSEWAQVSSAEVARQDETIRELQAALDEPAGWAREGAARVADQDGVVQAPSGRVQESRPLLAEAAQTDADRLHRLEQDHGRLTVDLKARLDLLQRKMDELVALSHRSVMQRLFNRRSPRIGALRPSWTEAGVRFNPQQDGRSHIVVEGSGFGHSAILVVGGRLLETVHASNRLLSASIPEELLGRPGVLPVWVDNRDGARSAIRSFQVLSTRTAAAFGPATGRRRLLKAAFNRLVRLAFATSWRMRTPLLYLQRRWTDVRSRLHPPLGGQQHRRVPTLPAEVVAHIRPSSVPRKPDVICFSIIDWDFRYQRPQQILSRLAKAGHRVFYLSQRMLSPAGEAFRLRRLSAGVTEVFLQSPSKLNVYKDALKGEVENALYRSLLEFKQAVGLMETICFVNLPFWTPLALRLKTDFGCRIVFDCLDDFSGFQGIGNRMLELESVLATHADLVIATSRLLAEKHAARKPLLVPNAADYDHFAAPTAPALRRDGARPIVGYYGAISHWFDADLIAQAAGARPGWQFVLIGRADPDVQARLRTIPNIRLLPELPYDDLPAHLAAFDVCLIPFIMGDLVKATNPVKFFEYLSAGKPVVAARMPELEAFSSECFLYDDLQGFLDQVETALAQKDDPRGIEARRSVAMTNTWEARCDVLHRAFHRLYPRASVIVVTYNGLQMTQACVESLLEKTAYADWELIVVDNASSDATPEYLRSLSERHSFVRIVLNDTNRGFAAANNQGVRIATGEFIVLLNNDTVVTLGWLGRLLRHLADTSVGLIGPVTNNIGNEAMIETTYGNMVEMEAFAEYYTRQHIGDTFHIPMLALFCVAMRRLILDEAGMLDERYEVGMFEDDDFSRTLKARGYQIVCAEDVFIHHVGGGTFRKLDPEVYRQIFDSNRRRYEEKWGEPWIPHRSRPTDAVRRTPAAPVP